MPRKLPLSNRDNAGQDIQSFIPVLFQFAPKSRRFYRNLLIINTLYLFTNLFLKIALIYPAANQNYARIS